MSVLIDPTDRDKATKCVDVSKMSDIYIAELVCDWQAMAEELKTNTAREWFNKQQDKRWHFSEYQVELINRLLKVFEEEKVEEAITPTAEKDLEDIMKIQLSDPSVTNPEHHEDYMQGLANGLICAQAVITGEEPLFFNADGTRDLPKEVQETIQLAEQSDIAIGLDPILKEFVFDKMLPPDESHKRIASITGFYQQQMEKHHKPQIASAVTRKWAMNLYWKRYADRTKEKLGVKEAQDGKGECLRNAFQYAMKNGGEVVHGTVTNKEGKSFLHAWVEDGDLVIDPTQDLQIEKSRYYKLLNIQNPKTYSVEELGKKLLKDKEYRFYESVNEYIRKEGSKWVVKSHKGKTLGTYDSKEEAAKRLKQIEFFKHKNEATSFPPPPKPNDPKQAKDITIGNYHLRPKGTFELISWDELSDERKEEYEGFEDDYFFIDDNNDVWMLGDFESFNSLWAGNLDADSPLQGYDGMYSSTYSSGYLVNVNINDNTVELTYFWISD